MFDIGFSEMILLGVIALFAIGPKQLPEVARKVARVINDIKRVKDEFTGSITDVRSSATRMFQETQDDILKGLNEETPTPSTDVIAAPVPNAEATPMKLEPVIPPPWEGPLPEPDPGSDLPAHTPYTGEPEQMSMALDETVKTKSPKDPDER